MKHRFLPNPVGPHRVRLSRSSAAIVRGGVAALALALAAVSPAPAQITALTLPPPDPTAWIPIGCRDVPSTDAVLPLRDTWTNMHSDSLSSDEIDRVIGPMLVQDWTVEGATYNPTGPVFDSSGNLYFSPLAPFEDFVLASLDPSDGSRRWSIAGTSDALPGGSSPMVLADPDSPGEQIVYLALYDRALAVTTDGSTVWDVPTGLTLPVDRVESAVLGLSYHVGRDAIVAVTADGQVIALDRATGASILSATYELPGNPSPDIPSAVPAPAFAASENAWQVLVDLPDGSFDRFVNLVLGQDVEVANNFSIDPFTGRIWIAATAPDNEDGNTDGLSEFGALYGLDLVADGPDFEIVEACHASFAGGSASTPALRADGTRIYVGDNFGKLLAYDASDCGLLWEVDLEQQIVGSVAVSSDNGVVYASSRDFVSEVFDRDTFGEIGWQTGLAGLFGGLSPGQVEFNLNLTSIGASGLGFQAGAGLILADVPLALSVGVGVLDRETGEVRHFTAAPEETVAVMSSAGDGGVYLGNSPIRRAFAIGLGFAPGPLIGGITKFAVARHDLLASDAACAAQARVVNAESNASLCAASADADAQQALNLIAQVRDIAHPQALLKTEMSTLAVSNQDVLLTAADMNLDAFLVSGDTADLLAAADGLSATCAIGPACPSVPMTGCRAADKGVIAWKQNGGVKDKVKWSWKKGDALTLADLADPTVLADYGLCLYGGSPARVLADATIPTDPIRWLGSDKGYAFKDKSKPSGDDGISSVKIKIGNDSKASASVKGKGINLPDPSFGTEGPVVVQLVNRSNGLCLSTSFAPEDMKVNEEGDLKAKH